MRKKHQKSAKKHQKRLKNVRNE